MYRSPSFFDRMVFRRFRRFPYRRRSSRFAKRKFKRTFRSVGSRRRDVSLSTQSTRGTRPVYFKARRFNARRYKSQLLADTRSMSHYRSYGQVPGTINSAGITQGMELSNISLLTNGVAAFWFGTGGAQPIDTGVALPLFKGDITVRGGKWTFSAINNTTKILKVFAWYYWSIKRPNFTILPAGPLASYDPTITADFASNIGRVLKSEVYILKPGEGFNWERRLRPMKIDEITYNNNGNLPYLLIGVQNLTDNTINGVSAQTGFNLSFSADAIGTT